MDIGTPYAWPILTWCVCVCTVHGGCSVCVFVDLPHARKRLCLLVIVLVTNAYRMHGHSCSSIDWKKKLSNESLCELELLAKSFGGIAFTERRFETICQCHCRTESANMCYCNGTCGGFSYQRKCPSQIDFVWGQQNSLRARWKWIILSKFLFQ